MTTATETTTVGKRPQLAHLTAALEEMKQRGTHFKLRVLEDEQEAVCTYDGKRVINLSSNNYLGLTTHPKLREAAIEATRKYGVGSGAVRTIAGTMRIHMELEEKIACFKNVEACVVFQSGFAANAGTVSSILSKEDFILSDELNHASIIDGARLSRAKIKVFRHKDIVHAEELLKEVQHEPGRKLLITDGVFSMDGDVAPLPDLHELARRHGCRLMVDEAHGTGALGPGGRGAVAAAGLSGAVDVIVGTLGKALGSYGAYVCVSAELRDLLINTARPFIFSTAPPPPSAGAALAALDLLASRPGLVEHLRRNAAVIREALSAQGLDVGASRTQIVPVLVGDARRAMALCERALDEGVFAQAIRPPTVPDGTSRLRLTVMANHRTDELQHAARVIGRAAHELGIADSGRDQLRRAA